MAQKETTLSIANYANFKNPQNPSPATARRAVLKRDFLR
jgi:hypothetical protein